MKWFHIPILVLAMIEPMFAQAGQVLDADRQLQEQIIRDIAGFTHDPLGFVRYAYDWGQGPLEKATGPRVWQADILNDIGIHLQNPETRFQPFLEAVASGKGIGKSTLVAWICWWGLSTCEDTKVIITANTDTQLRTKTATEINKWALRAINRDWFAVYSKVILSRDKKHERTWRADLIPWSVDNPEAFSGMHNQGKRIIIIFDEASAIHDTIWDVIEGALTDEDTEIIFLAFGNPTRNTGRFRECFGKFKHRWPGSRQIDSRKVEGTNKIQIAKWIEDYGEDSDHVRILVRGEFPRIGFTQFIPSDAVEAARRYKSFGHEELPKILGVDVARYGDDQTVIMLRQGRYSELMGKWRGLSTAQTTAHVIAAFEKTKADAIVVDSDGIGATVYDQLEFQGYKKHSDGRILLAEFHGGKPAFDENKYFNRRSEVWGEMRDWLIAQAQIPDLQELHDDLVGPEYGYTPRNQIALEKKDDMKERGLSSPDLGDALAMTFAVKLLPKPKPQAPAAPSYPGRGFGWA